MKFSMERMIEVWNDNSGEHIEIGPDRDGLDLVEFRAKDADGKVMASYAFMPEQANMVGLAMIEVASTILRKEVS